MSVYNEPWRENEEGRLP